MFSKSEIKALNSALSDVNVYEAAIDFFHLKGRQTHPIGTFDHAGRFYLGSKYSCCRVRTPSRAHPYSQMVHGRSAEHVARSYGVADMVPEIKTFARLCEGQPELENDRNQIEVLLLADQAFKLANKQVKRLGGESSASTQGGAS